MSHRSKGVMVKGEQLPGNCVLLGKGSLMALVGPALWAVACVCRDMQPCTRGFFTCSYHNSELEALTACVGNESARVLVNTHALLTPAPCFSATRLHELPGERISAGTRGTVQAVFMCTTLLGKRFNCLAPLNLSLSLFFFSFSNKTDEAISLDDLQKLKLAFEVLDKRTQSLWQFNSRRCDSISFFFFSLRRILRWEACDPLMWKILAVYWRTVWICLTQWDSVTFLFMSYSLSDFLILVHSFSLFLSFFEITIKAFGINLE